MILFNICNISAMDISELQWHVKQEKQELIKAEEKLDYASTINKAGFVNVRSLNIPWVYSYFMNHNLLIIRPIRKPI